MLATEALKDWWKLSFTLNSVGRKVTLALSSDGPQIEKVEDVDTTSSITATPATTMSPYSEMAYQGQMTPPDLPSEASSAYVLNWLQNAWEKSEVKGTNCYRLKLCQDSSSLEESKEAKSKEEEHLSTEEESESSKDTYKTLHKLFEERIIERRLEKYSGNFKELLESLPQFLGESGKAK